jgi:large exoprotein involved in heme utilization and adhesion
MTQDYTPDVDDKTFQPCQIGKGMKPLAQRGTVVFSANGVVTLLGTKGEVLDSAPVAQVSAKRLAVTFGQTVSLTLQDRKYNVSSKANGGIFGAIKVAKNIVALTQGKG